MNKFCIALYSILFLLFGCSKFESSNSEYQYRINLDKIAGDKLFAELKFIGQLTDTSYFYLPKIIPGIIKLFIKDYIDGSKELPLKEDLQKVGFDLDHETGKISEIKPVSENQIKLRKQWINQ